MANLKEIVAVNIEDEMKSSYLDYAMSVIVGRALPDARDGLKPAHRRILYAMYREGLLSNKSYSKCAGVVGEVLKKYHPHGDMAVYDTLVRMAQSWNLRYPLIDGQGNFGSVDGDSAAAYRYTECRLTPLAEEMMADIDKRTVNFIPNFDNSTVEPVVLPTRIPNLLINGSDGIAVGMATKIPPHNLSEIIDALVALVKNPQLSMEEILKIIPGPDFPTGGFIYGKQGIRSALETGRGIIHLRAKAEIEKIAKGDREAIIITEIPYQVNKARLIESIAGLVNDDRLEGISELRDESDRDGMRIVIELKKGTVSAVVLNQLYKHTAMQSSYGIIMLSIVSGRPRVLNIKEMLQIFLEHRKEVVIRRTTFELEEAKKRAHLLEGLKIAVDNIDEVVALIKKAANPGVAKLQLIERFSLSDLQAQAILEMRLQRLTGLERDKIIKEYQEVCALIKTLEGILSSEKTVMDIIVQELLAIKEKYGDKRRTEIIAGSLDDFSAEDLIQEEDMVVTVSHLGYIKRNPPNLYRAQRRGGRGITGMTARDEDFVEQIFVTSTHSSILTFTNKGQVYWLKVHEIPQAGRATRGKSISNLIALKGDESVAAILPVREFGEGQFIVFVTRKGTIKKTELKAYANPRAGGIIAITIDEGDELVLAELTDGKRDILISTREGQTIRFHEDQVRSMGRGATGVRGISLADNDVVVGMTLVNEGAAVLTVSENGYGKRTETTEYRVQGRGGSGVITMKANEKTGKVIGAVQVIDKDDIMLITTTGKIIRMHVSQISQMGRNTQGVRLINVESGEKVVSVAKLVEEEAVAVEAGGVVEVTEVAEVVDEVVEEEKGKS